MRVLMVHNAYQQRGGEDSVVESEVALLREHGHEVHVYERHNDEVGQTPKWQLAAGTVWSSRTVQDVQALIAGFKPDVMHVHNTMPLVSPSVYWAAQKLGVPVVQTLHNFRLLCPQAMFVREGRVCEDCLGKVPWRGVLHKCYRGSRIQSAVMAGMLTTHRVLGTFATKVDKYIALNEFCRAKMIEGGLDGARISVKPNFVDWQPAPRWDQRVGGLYLGRLTPEKGVDVLLRALARRPGLPMRVVGGGPMAEAVAGASGVNYLGFLPLAEIWGHLSAAAYMVVPSVWYEGFPRTIVEAFASGVPVIASRLGSLAEVVTDGKTGLLFNPGDDEDLAVKLAWADAHPREMIRMGQSAREEYEARYTPDRNCAELIEIYRSAMAQSG
ncbi:glycosyltransferase family 4 protein [Aquabacterium sp.]|uniref:glycosyltransferase family 4 protein n=1 Tax=Aquabacterium sp. TaxID=1872578 RepID=UPI0019C0178F|nr:glycosyltransferase family 4 protein [Aquabacterium sp.]MBC7699506.1 glycosyltransferase family 4 protein [Aquabacterium sp.]